MQSFLRGEVGVGLGTEMLILVVELAFHAKVSSSIRIMLDLVPMFPLIPGEMVELDKETLGPAFARFPGVVPVVVALLEVPPGGGEKAFQQILPANGRLRGGGTVDFILLEVREGESAVAPPVEVCEQGLLDAGVGVGFLKVGSQLGNAFIPHFIGTFSRAPKHMGGVLWNSTPRASVNVLAFPFDEGCAHATVGGSMFSNPTPPGRLQSLHAGGTGVPVDRQSGIEGEALVSNPVELGDGILDRCIQTFSRGGRKFGVTTPHCPTFIVNRELWGFEGGQDSAEVPIKELGSGIHFTVEG